MLVVLQDQRGRRQRGRVRLVGRHVAGRPVAFQRQPRELRADHGRQGRASLARHAGQSDGPNLVPSRCAQLAHTFLGLFSVWFVVRGCRCKWTSTTWPAARSCCATTPTSRTSGRSKGATRTRTSRTARRCSVRACAAKSTSTVPAAAPGQQPCLRMLIRTFHDLQAVWCRAPVRCRPRL